MNEKTKHPLILLFPKILVFDPSQKRKEKAFVIKEHVSGREHQADACSSQARRRKGDMHSYLLTLNFCLAFITIVNDEKVKAGTEQVNFTDRRTSSHQFLCAVALKIH